MPQTNNKENRGKVIIENILWKIIGRFDYLSNTINNKSSIIFAYNSFVFGTIILKWPEIIALFSPYKIEANIAKSFLFIVSIFSLFSLWSALRAIYPYLKATASKNITYSSIYFDNLSDYDLENYINRLRIIDQPEFEEDIANQILVIAKSLKIKFYHLQRAVGTILYIQLPIFGLIIIIKIETVVRSWLGI